MFRLNEQVNFMANTANANFYSGLCSFLFRNNPIPMFLCDSQSLRILAANDSARAKYGYTRCEFRDMTVRDLRPHGDGPALDSALHVDRDTPSRSLWTHVTRSGISFAVEVNVVPFVRGSHHLFLMSALDASAWSDARLKLVRSEELHRSLVEECPFGIYRSDLATGRIEQANPAFLRTLGYTHDELSSISVLDFYLEPTSREQLIQELRSAGSVRDFETHFRAKDGAISRVSLSAYLFSDPATGHQHIQAYFLDITRQRELEECLSHSHRMEAVGRLAGGVAHDFNNIAQSISLSCELALQNVLSPAVKSKLLDVMHQAERAAEITRQLLAFSRRQVLQPRVVNVNDCVRNLEPLLTRAVGVDVALELKLDETVDHIFFDPEQLTLVLMHLADNSRNAMPKGGRLTIATSSAANPNPAPPLASDAYTLLTIADSGVGMDEAIRSHIFEPFFSTKNTTLTTGLGLSTVHGIITQSKGRIECESTPGLGTTFRIFLPVAAEQPAVDAPLLPQPGRGLRILLAEDDALVNKHLTLALRKSGFTVDSVPNGEEALARYANASYDVVVTDIIMPKMGGIELTKRLRPQDPNIPVILISGYSEEVGVLRHLPRNAIAYLQKPFAVAKLVATLRELLARSSSDDLAAKS
jgi:two-component system, cell cycle sensor histidine kinase and response regulator CckA